ncbi:hypothetical protein E1263_24770 [Kribbella antibiotica]|uniref:Uncharacterized protein n=1 Tax=Kribbella antibiotica TaxID=190195 RepID=A0A4R4ZHA1_9ACTN|nr:hypothetical protein [Kribbella antibiotica]TDD57064.1 hypothetical protein E1263_24770 [Kribbella antibiotica]
MNEFVCSRCGAVLTAALSRVALPTHAHQQYGHEMLPALMAEGTYAVDPEPSGQPWRLWDDVGAAGAATRGVFAPVFSLCFGAPGAVVVAPGDIRGTVLIPERCDGYCMGLDGRDGPNLACAQCGQPVATRIDDCSFWQAVWFESAAVRRVSSGGPARLLAWEELVNTLQLESPIEPLGAWSARWEAAIGVALAHLLTVSNGSPVRVPDGLLGKTLGRAHDALIPPGAIPRQLVLAGPGLPAPHQDAGIALVPMHPQTGLAWQPTGTAAPVPLDADVWMYLAFHEGRSCVPATGGIPEGVLRDDPLPMVPRALFAPDVSVFLHTLARLPAVREPWLRAIFDRATQERFWLF